MRRENKEKDEEGERSNRKESRRKEKAKNDTKKGKEGNINDKREYPKDCAKENRRRKDER